MKGKLVIAGGSIKSNIIYEEFVKLAGGETARIAIVPTAARDAEAALERFSKKITKCGVCSKRIIYIKIDPDKNNMGNWKSCGDDFKCLDFLDNVTGIWFVGGDQVKIIRGFLRSDGTDTKLLSRIRELLSSGGIIGGSSAGAAIMSESMIGGGTSEGALASTPCKDYIEYRKTPEMEDKGVLLISKGLSFFNYGIIDQHFEERRRQERLIEALFVEKVDKGYGISEDTAMICDLEIGMIKVIGSGRVAVIDISEGQRNNVKVITLEKEDTYNVQEGRFK
jgi:cyanophycinase